VSECGAKCIAAELMQNRSPVGAGQGTEDDVAAIRVELERFGPVFSEAMNGQMRAKLGLATVVEGDGTLADDWLKLLAQNQVDYAIAHRRLGHFSVAGGAGTEAVRDLFLDRPAFDTWAERYSARLQREHSVDADRAERMARANPKYILRNHLAEQAIRQAEAGDFTEVQRLLKVLSRPFDEQPEHEADAGFPPDWAHHLEVSCSS